MARFVIVSGDFVTTGGMDRANHALASYLARRGDRVQLVAYRAAADLLAHSQVSLRRVPKPLNRYLFGAPLLARMGRRAAAEAAGQGGRVLVNGGNCRWHDVNWVHYVHAAWPPKTAGNLVRRAKTTLAYRLGLIAERTALQGARLIIANSQRTRTDLIERVGVDPARVETVYYGTDPAAFAPITTEERTTARQRLGWTDARPTLAFVGALADLRKGFDTLFDAWTMLARSSAWDARLVVVGAGAALPAWKARASAAGLDRSLEFLGFRKDVPAILAACDGLVSPTRYEAFGLNVQEALCRGLPALVTASAGAAEHYPPELADLLIPDPNDASALAERLRLWRDSVGRPRPALTALTQRLRAYTWDDMAGRIAALIEAVGPPEPASRRDQR